MTTKPECFVAMPLTTPADRAAEYGGDQHHFVHVLDHLFAPAVELAGFALVRPVMSGADLIQAEIVRNLETASLVLCDISTHNPNVFFELGIRTALNLPVSLIRDDKTARLPFDTGILNTYTYNSSLMPWHIEGDIDALANHLQVSASRAQGTNALWKYFGLTREAQDAPVSDDPLAAQLEILTTEVRALQESRATHRTADSPTPVAAVLDQQDSVKWLYRPLDEYLPVADQKGTMPSGLTAEIERLLLDLATTAYEIHARVAFDSLEGSRLVLDTRPFAITENEWMAMVARAGADGMSLEVIEAGNRWIS